MGQVEGNLLLGLFPVHEVPAHGDHRIETTYERVRSSEHARERFFVAEGGEYGGEGGVAGVADHDKANGNGELANVGVEYGGLWLP